MSENSFNHPAPTTVFQRWRYLALVPLWVMLSFVLGALIVAALMKLAAPVLPIAQLNPALQGALLAAATYLIATLIAFGVPVLLRRRPVTRAELGLTQLPRWRDLLLAPAGFAVYFIVLATLMVLLQTLAPTLIDYQQTQEIGFSRTGSSADLLLAFITLVVLAPIAEEVLFRGYLYGKLRARFRLWISIIVTSITFGIVHFQWNVGIDVFIMSIVMCGLREITGSLWASILVHMLKNGLAFYILFIHTAIMIQ